MACSICREKGHTKKNCPKDKREKLLIQRSRVNMFIQIFPALVNNPVFMGLIWWRVSKMFSFLRFFNNIIVGEKLLDLMPFVDTKAFPPAVTLGASLQVAEDTKDYVDYLKETGLGQGVAYDLGKESQIVRYIEEGIKFLFAEESPFPEYDPVTGLKYSDYE